MHLDGYRDSHCRAASSQRRLLKNKMNAELKPTPVRQLTFEDHFDAEALKVEMLWYRGRSDCKLPDYFGIFTTKPATDEAVYDKVGQHLLDLFGDHSVRILTVEFALKTTDDKFKAEAIFVNTDNRKILHECVQIQKWLEAL